MKKEEIYLVTTEDKAIAIVSSSNMAKKQLNQLINENKKITIEKI